MNNIRTIILAVIIFVIALAGIYYLYQTQVNKNNANLIPYPSPGSNFESAASPSPSPSPGAGSQAANPPKVQPASGSDTVEVKNIGIRVTGPEASSKISSSVKVSGFANVFEGRVAILVKDGNGQILGRGQATACMGYDACPFETTVSFNQSTTQAGTLEVYSPSGIDGSAQYLQTLLVRF